MAFEIAIDELGIGNDKVAYVTLPANKNAVIDAMDRAKIRGETFLRIATCDEIPELEAYEFAEEPTLDELNFLAKRIEEISEDNTQILAYRALLRKTFDTINEAINRTFNLETVPVYPCKNFYEYGEIVLDNELLEELREVPDEVYDLLDPEKVGRVMAERENGVFIDGYYIAADCYEPVLAYDETLPEQPDEWIFRLEIANNSGAKFTCLMLPTSEKAIEETAEKLGENRLGDCVCAEFQSVIPQINKSVLTSANDIFSLNHIAENFSKMSRDEAAKFKAALEFERPQSLEKVEFIVDNLEVYEFDKSLNSADYAKKFGYNELPPSVAKNIFSFNSTEKLGEKILEEMHCKSTAYGVISERGGRLFPENFKQENTFEMGGIS